MQLYRLSNLLFGLFSSLPGRDAAWKVGNISRIVALCLFDDNGVTDAVFLHFFRPACLRMLFKVPGARSSFGLPATVTRPTFFECLNWRWLPSVTTRHQPSALSTRFHKYSPVSGGSNLVSGAVATVLNVGAAVLSGELPRLRLLAGRRSEIGSHIHRFFDI